MKFATAPTAWAAALLFLVACGGPGQEGDVCHDEGDCAEGLECHLHDHGEEDDEEPHGECEAHDDDDHDDDHEDEHTDEDEHSDEA